MAEPSGPAAWTDEDVRSLVEQARAEARVEAMAALRAELARDLLARARAQLTAGGVADQAAGHARPAPFRPVPAGAPGLCYVYGVVESGATLPPDEPDLELVPHGGLAAVVQRVPAVEFDAEALRTNLEDLEWLRVAASRHEQVLAHLLPGPLVPLRLCSVFRSPESVRGLLAERGEALSATLDRVRGHDELGVKVVTDPEALRRAAAHAAPAGESTGAGYLARRRHERQAEGEARGLARLVGDEAHAVLSELSSAARRRPPQDPRLSRTSGWMVLNGAYLVPAERVGAFRRLADDLGERYRRLGAVVSVTGPWAPYSFVAADEDDEDDDHES